MVIHCQKIVTPCKASFEAYLKRGVINNAGLEDKVEKAMAPHSSTLAWKIPWTEEPGRLQSMGSQRLSDFTCTFHFHALEKEMATRSSVLAWRIQGRGSLVGWRLWGQTESDTTEAT